MLGLRLLRGKATTYNLSILDFKLILIGIIRLILNTYNLSILDFKWQL